MEALIVSTLIVSLLVLGGYCTKKCVEGSITHGVVVIIVIILLLAGLINSVKEDEKKGPCLKEEIGQMYNSQLGVMQSYSYCVARGKWVEEN